MVLTIGLFCGLLPSLDGNILAIDLDGALAQLGEHLLCKQGVNGSIPLSSTKSIGLH